MALAYSSYTMYPDATAIGLPIPSGHLPGHCFQVFVRSLTTSTLSISVAPDDFVLDLKRKLQARLGIPAEQQRLIFAGKQLKDDRSLAHCNIEREATVDLVLRLRGGLSGPCLPAVTGVKFADVSDASGKQRLPWVSSGPEWYRARPGLCIEGYCTTSGCRAHRKLVIHNVGSNIFFDLIEDRLSPQGSDCECPCCHNTITPVTAAFNRCEWRFQGVKLTGPRNSPQFVESQEWQVVGDYYERFNPGNQVGWSRLLLVARPRFSSNGGGISIGSASSRSSSTGFSLLGSRGSTATECNVCFEKVSPFDSAAISTPCGHTFHTTCLKPWMQLGNKGCPTCRSDISGMRPML